MARSGGRRKAQQRLLAVALSMVVILGSVEAVIRLAVPDHRFLDRRTDCYWVMRLIDSWEEGISLENVELDVRLGWTMRTNYSSETESTNSQGLRADREIPLERTPGLRRLAVLGDSFTYGLGVANDETFCARLEQEIPNLETLNMGVNGWGTDQQCLFWASTGRHYSPDAALLAIYVPDFHRNGLSIRELPKPRFEVVGEDVELRRHEEVRPIEILRGRVEGCRSSVRLLDVLSYTRRWLAGREADGPFDEKARIMGYLFERMKDATDSDGVRFGIVIIPDQTYRDYQDHERIEAVIEREAARLGIPCLNLTDPFLEWQAAHPDVPLYDSSHGHWSVVGHETAADFMRAFIEANRLL